MSTKCNIFIFVYFIGVLLHCGVVSTTGIKAYEEKELEEFFKDFQDKYDKHYTCEEEYQNRFEVFVHNFNEVEAHNRNPENKWKKGINAYSDLTSKEFEQLYLNGLDVKHLYNLKKFPATSALDDHAQDGNDLKARSRLQQKIKNIDWRLTGAISPVKDQGRCGSCWAFAAVEEIESYVHIETGEKVILSPQQISSCAKNGYREDAGGCNGSWPEFGFSYAQLFGVVSEESYPYVSGETMEATNCEYDPENMKKVAKIRGYQSLPQNNIQPILDHLSKKGPLSAAMYASTIKDYESGVFDGCAYNESIMVNHAVQLVGYGTHPFDGDFWIVRNSWSADWGDKGYIKLKREQNLECGCYLVPENEQDECFTICGMCGIVWWNVYPIGADSAIDE